MIIKIGGKIIYGHDKCVASQITILRMLSIEQMSLDLPTEGIYVDGYGSKYRDGKLHCDDGPRLIMKFDRNGSNMV